MSSCTRNDSAVCNYSEVVSTVPSGGNSPHTVGRSLMTLPPIEDDDAIVVGKIQEAEFAYIVRGAGTSVPAGALMRDQASRSASVSARRSTFARPFQAPGATRAHFPHDAKSASWGSSFAQTGASLRLARFVGKRTATARSKARCARRLLAQRALPVRDFLRTLCV